MRASPRRRFALAFACLTFKGREETSRGARYRKQKWLKQTRSERDAGVAPSPGRAFTPVVTQFRLDGNLCPRSQPSTTPRRGAGDSPCRDSGCARARKLGPAGGLIKLRCTRKRDLFNIRLHRIHIAESLPRITGCSSHLFVGRFSRRSLPRSSGLTRALLSLSLSSVSNFSKRKIST